MLKFSSPDLTRLNPDPLSLNTRSAEKRNPSFVPKARRKSQLLPLLSTIAIGICLAAGIGYLILYSRPTKIEAIADQTPSNSAVGKIVVTDGDNCRKLEFDNLTGSMKGMNNTNCDLPNTNGSSAARPQYQYPTNRMDSVRRGFLK